MSAKHPKTKLLAAGIATALLGAGAAHADTELTVVSWGGAYSASQQGAYHDPWMAMNPDVKIVNDDSAAQGLAKLRAMAESDNWTWDLVDMEADGAIAACDEGLVIPINHDRDLAPAPDGTPASEDFGQMIASECFIPQIVYSTTIGYRTDLVKTAPTSIEDVFDLRKIPGKRALQKRAAANLEWALFADGVSTDRIYDVLSTPAGVERAFAKLDTIKDQIVWWEQGAQPPQLLADGEVVIASGWNGRLFNAIAVDEQPIAIMWDRQILNLDGWTVPRGTKNMDEVMRFLRFATDSQRLADQAKFISYGPARQSSIPLVGKHGTLGIDMAPHMPTRPEVMKSALLFNYEWWADHNDELNERFNAWLARS